MRPPSSIPASSRLWSCGLGAIQRTWDVQGRGGKLQVGREGRSSNASSAFHVVPLSPLANRRLGSVPAYTVPSAGLTASEKTPGSGSAQSTHDAPKSSLRRTPPSRSPAKTVSGLFGSTARHWAPAASSERVATQVPSVSSRRTIASPVAANRRAISSG